MFISDTGKSLTLKSTELGPHVGFAGGVVPSEQSCPDQPAGYTNLRVIGTGATSIVYSALRDEDGRQVALKQLKIDFVSTEHIVADFLSEARLLLGLRHPNLIRCHDFFFDRGAWWLVLEYLAGGDIHQTHATSNTEGRTWNAHWMNQIATAICYLHSHGIVHCDIKPANILVDGPRAVLADLGLACVLKQPRHRENRICGTPEFMSDDARRGIICPENDWYAFRQTAERMGVAQLSAARWFRDSATHVLMTSGCERATA